MNARGNIQLEKLINYEEFITSSEKSCCSGMWCGTRDAGAEGGSGGNLPPQLGSCGGAPPNFGLSMSFIFIFVCFCT